MGVTVRVPYLSWFRIPPMCVACGAPPAEGAVIRVSGSASGLTGTRVVSLEFPLCARCEAATKDNPPGRTIRVAGGLLGMLVLITGAGGNSLAAGAILGLMVIGISFFIADRLSERELGKEQRTRRKRARKAAHIVDFRRPGRFSNSEGSVVFDFADSPYGAAFAAANGGQVLGREWGG